MNYFSVCDGIGAAHVALLPLGYRCVGVSEIDKYCNQLIEEKYGFKNYGDFTKWKKWGNIDADLVIGGTPCTSFSIIGKKQGTKCPDGRLLLEFASFVSHHTPRLFIWENVPNIFSIDKGKTFRHFLYQFQKRGYGLAWRVFNAQFFGVPQRRRRIFLVGCFGDPARAGAVLFDTENMQGIAPKRKAAKKNDSHVSEGRYRNNSIAGTLTTKMRGMCHELIDAVVLDGNRPRIFTPLEYERLMGFEDGYTSGFSNYQRYKMLGNSMPVPVIRWIGKRILESEVNQ